MQTNQAKATLLSFILIYLLQISPILAILTSTETIPNIGQVDYNEIDNYLWIEAEDGTIIYLMSVVDDVEASGGKYVHAPDGTDPMDEGYVEYNININKTDTYRLWGRVYWLDGASNSFSVAFDREPLDSDVFGNDDLMNQWHWINGLDYTLSTGTHTLKFKDREDGSKLDKIFLTNDLLYIPIGIGEFTGNKMEYVDWLTDGYVYHIDDDSGLTPRSGVVNDAFLYLTAGPSTPSTFTDGKNVSAAYKDQMLAFVSEGYDFGGDRDRVLTSIAESYIHMREEGIFNLSEQQHLEEFFLHWADVNAQEEYGHQFVPHALAAVVSHVLNSTNTGTNYSSDVDRLRGYALNNSLDFGETFGPVENSAHYNPFVFISMMRVSLYCNDGVFPEGHKENLKKAVEWILDVYPHNGFGLSFGETWSPDHVRQLFSFLIGAAHFLDDGAPENVEVARNAKWLSNELFNYGLTHDYVYDALYWEEWRAGVRGEPMLILAYAKDSLVPLEPDVDEHGSKAVYGEMGNSYSSGLPHVLKPDKVVHRDGWGDDSFYLLLDMAPSSGKNTPYANSIVNFVYGDEPFSTGKTRDRYNTVWEKRNIVNPASRHTDSTLSFMENLKDISVSKTQAGDWDRYICFVKEDSYAVVFDFASSEGTLYWHLQGDPSWYSDYVDLLKGDRQLYVYYPNDYGWYSINHYDSYEEDGRGRSIWYVGVPSRELELLGAQTWATVLYPYRSETPSVSAIRPTVDGVSVYPDAVGVKLVHNSYVDWNGASRLSGMIEYDVVTTDAEIFSARNVSDSWVISYVNGNSFNITTPDKPVSVEVNSESLVEGEDWHYSAGVLSIDVPGGYATGTITIRS